MDKYSRLPINRKLGMISLAAILPMVILACYLLWTLYSATGAYADINNNVAQASNYVQDFKQRIDYTMYFSVIRNKTIDELNVGTATVNGIVTVNPYDYINELENACDELSASATVGINRNQIMRVKNTLKSLENCIMELEKNIKKNNSYDSNMKYLDDNIYALTGLVKSGIQNYIYIETTNFNHVKAELDKNNQKTILICIITSIVAVILSTCLSARAAHSITVPIRNLCALTSKVAEGDFTAKTKVEAGDEIAVLAHNFNDMTQEIGNLVEDMKHNHETLRIIETKLLQAQINPHFLYNTLDTVVWLAEAGKNMEVVAIVTYLSDFFRTTLSKGKDFITIREEKLHIESYLKIQQFRYQDILDYDIDIEEALYEYTIPKLLLQPLVENALVHGIRNKRGQGHLVIRGSKKEDKIVFQVIDDGRGMDKEELTKLRKSIANDNNNNASENSGFGVVNVNQRIHIYYGEEYGVSFESSREKGTTATVIVAAKEVNTIS